MIETLTQQSSRQSSSPNSPAKYVFFFRLVSLFLNAYFHAQNLLFILNFSR